MSESLPPACADCQKRLSLGPDAFDQPDVRNHLASCATCSQLSAQYYEMDRLLQHMPDLKPLPDLALRFQQIPQAQHISELDESFTTWEGMLEEKLSLPLLKPWLDEPALSPLYQGKKTMPKQPIIPAARPSNERSNEQFQPPLNLLPHARRSFWRVLATSVAVLLALVLIFAWTLLPHLMQPSTSAVHREPTPTTALATPTPTIAPATSTPGLTTQQYTFTAQDSGKTIRYVITSRFTLILNQQQYPRQNLQLSCEPQGALGSLASMIYAAPPSYSVQYEANAAGTCTLKNGSFMLTVVIIQ